MHGETKVRLVSLILATTSRKQPSFLLPKMVSQGSGKRGHIVADTLLLMVFLGRANECECCVSMLRKLGNICCGHKMLLNKIRNIFCVPDTKFVSATNVAHAGKRGGNICVRNNVSAIMCPQNASATMCPRLPGPSCLRQLKFSIQMTHP